MSLKTVTLTTYIKMKVIGSPLISTFTLIFIFYKSFFCSFPILEILILKMNLYYYLNEDFLKCLIKFFIFLNFYMLHIYTNLDPLLLYGCFSSFHITDFYLKIYCRIIYINRLSRDIDTLGVVVSLK